jgi:hypothetical protein
VTRYPVTGQGSIYPSWPYVKTTVHSQSLKELDDQWQPTGNIAKDFPIRGERFYNSVSPHYTKLRRLGADFDGDTVSFNVLYTEDAIQEIKDLLKSRRFYLDPTAGLAFSADNDVLNMVLAYMTG